jgi:hypothetical protein
MRPKIQTQNIVMSGINGYPPKVPFQAENEVARDVSRDRRTTPVYQTGRDKKELSRGLVESDLFCQTYYFHTFPSNVSFAPKALNSFLNNLIPTTT